MPRVVLTYGTFDLFHIGHLNLLQRARALGDYLVVGVSTDAFNAEKGKETIISFADRLDIVRSLRCVDEAIPEISWDQKPGDVRRFNVDTLVMGDDWTGKFDHLKDSCKVIYLPRTQDISSTNLKLLMSKLGEAHIEELKKALDIIASIVHSFGQRKGSMDSGAARRGLESGGKLRPGTVPPFMAPSVPEEYPAELEGLNKKAEPMRASGGRP